MSPLLELLGVRVEEARSGLLKIRCVIFDVDSQANRWLLHEHRRTEGGIHIAGHRLERSEVNHGC